MVWEGPYGNKELEGGTPYSPLPVEWGVREFTASSAR